MKWFLTILLLFLLPTASNAEVYYPSTAYDLSVAATQIDSQPLNAHTYAVRLVCSVDCHIALLSSTADTFKQVSGTVFLPADVPIVLRTSGAAYVTGVSASGGTLNITELSK